LTTPVGGSSLRRPKRLLAGEKLLAGNPSPPHRPLIKTSHQREVGGGGSHSWGQTAAGWLPAAGWTGPPPSGGGVPFAFRKALFAMYPQRGEGRAAKRPNPSRHRNGSSTWHALRGGGVESAWWRTSGLVGGKSRRKGGRVMPPPVGGSPDTRRLSRLGPGGGGPEGQEIGHPQRPVQGGRRRREGGAMHPGAARPRRARS